ncbi:hypothetical protein EMIT0P171_10715 [Pseudomonas sp. IT-P171]
MLSCASTGVKPLCEIAMTNVISLAKHRPRIRGSNDLSVR